jgi:hypothetical protein
LARIASEDPAVKVDRLPLLCLNGVAGDALSRIDHPFAIEDRTTRARLYASSARSATRSFEGGIVAVTCLVDHQFAQMHERAIFGGDEERLTPNPT